jgi:hypothetical protein
LVELSPPVYKLGHDGEQVCKVSKPFNMWMDFENIWADTQTLTYIISKTGAQFCQIAWKVSLPVNKSGCEGE